MARYPDAEAQFLTSLELAPDRADGYRDLSAVYYMQGRLPEAARALQKALAIRPDRPFEVCRAELELGGREPPAPHPAGQRPWLVELVRPGGGIGRVHERLDDPQVAGRRPQLCGPGGAAHRVVPGISLPSHEPIVSRDF